MMELEGFLEAKEGSARRKKDLDDEGIVRRTEL